ncbi:hypothetical protein Sa4125_45000 [Aureimonas sp. SA4125]|uniref:hypothetical protein n=1 Tax=Aureimonas sp. SA4125 TaxID=2826993 RepID=UPI001CC47C33|nr:hypothetical protein [Aureimonas sp. SA4125]BDA86958.1 hypothetical protein Sa4125_45000 [Aureimonas sp. SA4125]
MSAPMPRASGLAAALAALVLAACQSGASSSTAGPAGTGAAAARAAASETAEPTAAGTVAAYGGQPAAPSGALCAVTIAGGPPPKPAKGADFGTAVGKNIGRNVGKSIISGLGGAIAGPLGGVVAGAVANDQVRPEQDLKGKWTATDGSPTCGCTLTVNAGINLQGQTATAGRIQSDSCTSPLLAQSARWTLGHSFTGYDAPLQILASNRQTVLATLKRDGMNYFSGTMADGTPMTLWRD